MRITNSTILRGYNRSLNKLLNSKTSSEHKIMSGRKFDRASESPLSAAKALNVRQSLYESAQHSENLKTANTFYTEAETSLLEVSEQLQVIRETLVAACNSTKEAATDLNIYAQQLETKASELCSIFNTDTAGRVIFGGESNDAMPFTISNDADGNASTVLYHGVPVNALSDSSEFPYSDEVYIDIGVGMTISGEERKIDPQSVLRISFNGAKVSGCGSDGGYADIDLSTIKKNYPYKLDVYAGNVKKTITFTGGDTQADNVTALQTALTEAFQYETDSNLRNIKISDDGVITAKDSVVYAVNSANAEYELTVDNAVGYTNNFSVDLDAMTNGGKYSMCVTANGVKKEITITAGADADANRTALQSALDSAFGTGKIYVADDGRVTSEGTTVKLTPPESGATAAKVSNTGALQLGSMKDGTTYSVKVSYAGDSKEITFVAGASESDNKTAFQTALDTAFGAGVLTVESDGRVSAATGAVKLSESDDDLGRISYSRDEYFSNNYIQLTLDAAKSLRNGDIEYAGACIDRIVSASENLLVEIADMGCNEEYIDFNITRIETRTLNLKERQDDLEATDLESEITLMKTYEALYNATLQMSSMVVPNSIFNYIS